MISKNVILNCLGIALISSMFIGCGKAPVSTELIQPPKVILTSSNEKNQTSDKNMIVAKFLPKDMVLFPPMAQEQKKAIITKDLNGDGKEEIIFTFKSSKDPYTGGVIVLAKNNTEWKVVLSDYGEGESVYKIDFADIDGDKNQELLVSSFIGGSAGNNFKIYKIKDGKVKTLDETLYKKIDIEDMPNVKDKKDGKNEVATWVHDTGNSYIVEVFRYVKGGLVEAEDVYPYYFKKVVKYYEEELNKPENKEQPYMWYYLADAQVKANMPKESLKSLEKSIEYKKKLQKQSKGQESYPYDYLISTVKGEALYKIKDYKSSISELNKALSLSKSNENQFNNKLLNIYYGLGKNQSVLGNKDKAKEYYNMGVKVAEKVYKEDKQILFRYSYKFKQALMEV
ncbi:hypothetical protein RBU49_14180 [Clostridium sp. MB40-C1]|uniref:FG-GAP-like repeat-containing protein n=1 Tax=Clostridium sp. MB40-C1 TaxID=3070996 RepID=UPI0027DF064F|nr:FG-GAP-like repeat-containing protein [Clostridium sp. MB40-C1]WMJ80000.1 hypothetical protein RBU49_14180 [Clostridium sp. MB40-C1]